MNKNLPHRITFQWHITDKCNFRCKHCYQDDYAFHGVSYSNQLKILEQLSEFVQKCRVEHSNFRAHINFTGGEPFLRDDFLDLLQKTIEKKEFSFGILSNGFLLDHPKLGTLKKLNPKFIQISLEGGQKINDEIRGNGSFEKIVLALKTYSKLGIPIMVSFTANSANYRDFPKMVKIAKKYKTYKVWTDRHLPNSPTDDLTLNTEQTKEFFKIIENEQKKNKFSLFSKITISSNRALQFLVTGGQPYKCSAGNTLLAILANGDVLPCRRLPIKLGNILNENLIDLYLNNPLINNLHNPEKQNNDCKNCYYRETCNGGLKCLSFAKLNNYNKKDPNCWI